MDKERVPLTGIDSVEVIPDELYIPEEVEAKEGYKATRTQFTAKIKADDGTHLVSSPATKKVSIQLPTDEETLETMSKGDIEDSSTWSGVYWLRMVKKAVSHGWSIIRGQKPSVSPTKS
jgi:hypothetical protein